MKELKSAKAQANRSDAAGNVEPEAEGGLSVPPLTLASFSDADLIAELEARRREPVRPLSDFCQAVTTWFRCIERNATDPSLQGERNYGHGRRYHQWLGHIETDIRKSNLLARLLYAREPLRTEQCPIHSGHWDGQAMLAGCEHGCDGTGWLKAGAR